MGATCPAALIAISEASMWFCVTAMVAEATPNAIGSAATQPAAAAPIRPSIR